MGNPVCFPLAFPWMNLQSVKDVADSAVIFSHMMVFCFFAPYRIRNLFAHFVRMCCLHLQGDWTCFWLVLKLWLVILFSVKPHKTIEWHAPRKPENLQYSIIMSYIFIVFKNFILTYIVRSKHYDVLLTTQKWTCNCNFIFM
jgi:hypothetical protein